jgi:hypothetical protein
MGDELKIGIWVFEHDTAPFKPAARFGDKPGFEPAGEVAVTLLRYQSCKHAQVRTDWPLL